MTPASKGPINEQRIAILEKSLKETFNFYSFVMEFQQQLLDITKQLTVATKNATITSEVILYDYAVVLDKIIILNALINQKKSTYREIELYDSYVILLSSLFIICLQIIKRDQ